MSANYYEWIREYARQASNPQQTQRPQQQSQHRRYPSSPVLSAGQGGDHTTRQHHAHNLRAQAASPALSTSSYEHIVFGGIGGESDDDVVVYRPHAAISRPVHHTRSPSAPTFSTPSSTLAPPFAPTVTPRHAPAPRPAPTFQLRMIPWSDDRSDLGSVGSTDEIVFTPSGIAGPRPPFREDDTFSEATTEDNILFSRPRSRANWADDVEAATNGTGIDGIESALANLNMTEDSSSRVQSPTPPPSPGRKKRRHHHHHRRAKSDGTQSNAKAGSSKQSPVTPKARPGKLKPVVPEEEEVPDMPSSEALSAAYEEAARYITYFLSNPAKQQSKSAQLAFLQALIIELGLYQPPTAGLPTPPSSPPSSSPTTPSPPAGASPPNVSGSPPPLATMPSTLTSARAALKSRAFVSIREYLHARTEGRDAIAAVVHPTRSSLRRALQDKGERIVRGQAKEAGLGVLLVTCHYH